MNYTIYAVQNKVNKKLYIGRTENPKQRLKKHMSDLKNNRHPIEDMQDDYNKFGDVFELFILEENVSYNNEHLEYKYMKKYRTCEREFGYNYKDHIAKRINFSKPREIACKTEAEIEAPIDDKKIEYISTIVELLNQTNDLRILDFVMQFLYKSKTR